MMHQYEQHAVALGTDVELRLVAADSKHVEELFAALWKRIRLFEAQYSRFIPTSELTHVNMNAGSWVGVSDDMCRLLSIALEFAQVTDGAFNPFVLPALVREGYAHSILSDSDSTPDYSSRAVAPPDALEIEHQRVRIPENSALDLGGIGKGYLAELLRAQVHDVVEGYCLSLGGDMALAGTTEEEGNWEVSIQSASNRDATAARFNPPSAAPCGLATSGTSRHYHGFIREHQIEPATGHLATPHYDIVSVAASSSTAADVYASAILTRGEVLASSLLGSQKIYGACLQRDGQTQFIGKGFSSQEEQ